LQRILLTWRECPTRKHVIIAGNSVASSIAEFLLHNTEVDIAVKGEGELTFVNLLNALESGTSLDTVKGIVFCKDGKDY